MKRILFGKLTLLFSVVALVCVSVAVEAFAADSPPKFALIHVDELNALIKSDTKVAILDANNPDTRAKYGTIPGATLLESYRTYDVAKSLPADKSSKLVFYCANPRCTASHEAAQRAVDAGYKNVSVLSDGIEGWAKAGEKVELQKSKV